ncbi:MAG: helix-turn-helix domain-containing protein, partial [Bdellovibrionaceae bacterium]|nr:helix-turn-helix domain-containing protein [Pseudobdellovibrionaceae bacterium]
MKRTGELLKKVREEKGFSLHEIGLSLKINPKILRQIEDGEQNNLPAKTFLRGFVQSYANYLKLDSDEVLKIFSEEMGSTKPKSIPATPSLDNKIPLTISDTKAEIPKDANRTTSPSSGSSSKAEFEFKNFGIGFLVILLLLSLIGVRKIVEKYQKESEIPQNPSTESVNTTIIMDSKNNPLNPEINNPSNSTAPVTPTPQTTTSLPTIGATNTSATTPNLNSITPSPTTSTPTSAATKPQAPS